MMAAVVVAGLVVPEEKSAFKGPCVNNWRRRGERERRGGEGK